METIKFKIIEKKTTVEIFHKLERKYTDEFRAKYMNKIWISEKSAIEAFDKLESSRTTNNNHYVNIPIEDWIEYRKEIKGE